MANNDYFSAAYKILSYLKYCYENGEDPDVNVLQASTFNISQKQFFHTLQMLKEDGYVKGISFQSYYDRSQAIIGLDQVRITSDGLQYLAENSMMKKAYKVFKEVRDWLPIIK